MVSVRMTGNNSRVRAMRLNVHARSKSKGRREDPRLSPDFPRFTETGPETQQGSSPWLLRGQRPEKAADAAGSPKDCGPHSVRSTLGLQTLGLGVEGEKV